MTAQAVTATKVMPEGTEDRVGTVNYDFGDNIDEAVEKFTAEVVYKRFMAASIVDLQGLVRRGLSGDEPKKADALQTSADEWKPGISKPRVSKQEKALAALEDLSAEDKKAFIKELQASLKAA